MINKFIKAVWKIYMCVIYIFMGPHRKSPAFGPHGRKSNSRKYNPALLFWPFILWPIFYLYGKLYHLCVMCAWFLQFLPDNLSMDSAFIHISLAGLYVSAQKDADDEHNNNKKRTFYYKLMWRNRNNSGCNKIKPETK